MRRFTLCFVAVTSSFLLTPDMAARGHDKPSAVLLTERQNSDIRVVMYMTPW